MSDQETRRVLLNLYQMVDAGEKGFATAAANSDDPALKIFFKRYAQQRLNFKNELMQELRRLGVNSRPAASILGAIHRGRIAIFAGLSEHAGQERVILKEAAVGEQVAERTYARAVAANLPPETRALVERQYREVQKAHEQVRCLRDDQQRREAMYLASGEQDTRQAIELLIKNGFAPGEIDTVTLDEAVLYQGRGATLSETILSGAVGGALWGGLTGIFAGLGVVQTTDPTLPWLTWLLVALAFLFIGAFISSVLAFFIGISTSGEDNYQYDVIRRSAHTLVSVRACPAGD